MSRGESHEFKRARAVTCLVKTGRGRDQEVTVEMLELIAGDTTCSR